MAVFSLRWAGYNSIVKWLGAGVRKTQVCIPFYHSSAHVTLRRLINFFKPLKFCDPTTLIWADSWSCSNKHYSVGGSWNINVERRVRYTPLVLQMRKMGPRNIATCPRSQMRKGYCLHYFTPPLILKCFLLYSFNSFQALV